MNPSIGQQLQEARKRQGLSIKDASSSLKIKIDFLDNFENDRFDFDLPEVYMYGFLKLYSRYLKLDYKAVMAEYSTLKQINIHDSRKRESREILGRMHLSKKPQLITDTVSTHFKVLEDDMDEGLHQQEQNYDELTRKSSYKKPLLWGGAVAVLGVLCILLATFLNFGKTTPVKPADLPLATSSGESSLSQDTITLSSDNDIHVVVRQEFNKQRLYSGTISAKQPQAIVRKGPVKIHFSDGTSFLIKKANGEKVKPGRSGVGWIEV